jgi:hypothetical protein
MPNAPSVARAANNRHYAQRERLRIPTSGRSIAPSNLAWWRPPPGRPIEDVPTVETPARSPHFRVLQMFKCATWQTQQASCSGAPIRTSYDGPVQDAWGSETPAGTSHGTLGLQLKVRRFTEAPRSLGTSNWRARGPIAICGPTAQMERSGLLAGVGLDGRAPCRISIPVPAFGGTFQTDR